MHPPGIQPRRFKDKVRAGVFLGYLPHTIRNIISYNLESERVKIATHCVFDEGFNDVPVESLPPNVKHLIRINDGTRVDMKSHEMSCKDLAFHVYPFLDLQDVTIKVQANSKSEDFGLNVCEDEIYQRVYLHEFKKNPPAAKSVTPKQRKDLRGLFITHVDGHPVFSYDDTINKLKELFVQHCKQDEGGGYKHFLST